MTSSEATQEFAATLSDTIGTIYDCALDPSCWPKALAHVGAFIRGNRARIFLFNVNPAQSGDGDNFGVDREFNIAFDRDEETLASIKYGFVVSELDEAMTLPEIFGATGGRDVNGRLIHENRFYKEWMAPRGAHDALAALVVKTSSRFGGLAMTRSHPLQPFGPEEKAKVRLIAPHIRRALTIADMVGKRSEERDQFSDVIEALTTPVIIVDHSGMIAQANASARAVIDRRTLISCENGVLRAASEASRVSFRSAMARARKRHASTIALDAVDPHDAGRIATFLPLGQARGGASHAYAVFIHQPDTPGQIPGEAFAKLYKLTGTELRIALLLTEGSSVEAIAARLGSSVETVRWHIKNLRLKTGCARTLDLVKLATRAVSPVTTKP